MSDTATLILAIAAPSLICLAVLSLIPATEAVRANTNRKAQYASFFAIRYGNSLDRMFAESPLDQRLLREWCSQGPAGVKRAHRYIELWDPVPRAVADAYLRRIQRSNSSNPR